MTAGALQSLLDAARAHFARERRALLDLQRAIASVPSPTAREERRARFIRERLSRSPKHAVSADGAGNVVARRPGSDSRPVAICAHLDTVFPEGTPVEARLSGTRLDGPGVTDNARGLAGMLAIAGALEELDIRTHHPIDFVATVGEEGEGDLRGAKFYFGERAGAVAPVAAIALDGAGDERLVHRAVGSRRFRITFRGPGGHSWNDFGAANAVHAAARCAAALSSIVLPSSPRTTLTVARIEGGLSINAIPPAATLDVDIRSVSADQIGHLEGELRAAARRAAMVENEPDKHGEAALALEILRIGDRPCGETPLEEPLAREALAITRALGREPEPAGSSTDASAAIALGIPAIAIGAGGQGGGTHTLDEWYEDVDGASGLARAAAIVVAAAGTT